MVTLFNIVTNKAMSLDIKPLSSIALMSLVTFIVNVAINAFMLADNDTDASNKASNETIVFCVCAKIAFISAIAVIPCTN